MHYSAINYNIVIYIHVGVPVASPLSTLDSVLTWQQGHDDMSVPCVPLCPRIPNPFSEPNVIICHDMMGGYTKDRFIQVIL